MCRCLGGIGPSAGPGECRLLCMGLFSRFCLGRDAPPAAEPPCGHNAARAGFGNDPFQMRPVCRREMMSSGSAKRLRRTRFALAAPRGCATRSPQGRSVVPLAGIEPALLAELDFESSASTSSATGAFGGGIEAGARVPLAKPADYSQQSGRVNPHGCDCTPPRQRSRRAVGPAPVMTTVMNRVMTTT